MKHAAALLLICSALTVACERAETAPSAAAASSRDEALVRVVHAIPFASAMDVQDVDAFNGAIEVRSGDTTVLTLPNAHLESGRFYTMVVVGSVRGTPPLEAFIIEDQLSGR